MEEGPEPQELMEHVEESLHEKGHESQHSSQKPSEHGSKHLRSAITAASLAVLAALASLLSGHAANEAILLQTKASDQWSYFQAKSTKAHVFENDKMLFEAFAKLSSGRKANQTGSEDSIKELTAKVDAKLKSYDHDKDAIEEKAKELEKESAKEFASHQLYSFAVACFQIGIVIASVSILVDSNALFAFSIIGGAAGIVLTIMGYTR